jgi:hypothetical protein
MEQAVLLLSSSVVISNLTCTLCNSIALVQKTIGRKNFVEVMQTYGKNDAAKNLLLLCGKL